MTNTEQRVAKAINATAQQISADSIPPFRVAQAPSRFGGRLLPISAGRRWPLFMAPVAVAAAVAVIAVAAVVIGHHVASHRPPAGGNNEKVPPYYAALSYKLPFTAHMRVDVVIRSTATGKVLATMPAIPGYTPGKVSAAADDRTFVVAADKVVPATSNNSTVRFYLLRFDPGTGKVTVRTLPISVDTGEEALGIALSPDGRKLAVTTVSFQGIRVYSVPGGALRSWTTSGADLLGPEWTGNNRMLAYFRFAGAATGQPVGLRVLDTASRSHSLSLASHVPPIPRRDNCAPAWFVPRPTMVVCVANYGDHGAIKAYVEEISLRTGKLLRRLYLPGTEQNAVAPQVAWANPSGTKVIVLIGRSRPSPSQSASAFLVAGGRVTKLPGATWFGQLSDSLPASW